MLSLLLLGATLVSLASCVADWKNWYDIIPDVDVTQSLPATDTPKPWEPGGIPNEQPTEPEKETEASPLRPGDMDPDRCDAHEYHNNVCIHCTKLQMSFGLATSINYSNQNCSVSGIGNCEETVLYISSTFNNYFNYPLEEVDFYAFSNESHITMVALDEGLTTINAFAFENCTSLSTVVFPSTLKDIGGSAFSGCHNLRAVYYNGSPTSWALLNLSDNPTLQHVTVYFAGQWGYVDGIPTKIN